MTYDVIVLGSINMDIRVDAKKYPHYGDTVFAKKIEMLPGGKGSNQAVSVAKQNKKVAFVGAVGNDSTGKQMLSNLTSKGIETTHVIKSDKSGTGTFVAIVDDSGENTMLGTKGANDTISGEDIKKVVAKVDAKILLLQMETSKASILSAMKEAKHRGMYTILDPAPAEGYFKEALQYADLVTPNQQETECITGIQVTNQATAIEAAKAIIALGVPSVIVKMGAKGSVVYHAGEITVVDAFKTTAVDTVGAGDTFAGALAAALVENDNLVEAVTYATMASSIKVSRAGGQDSIPTEGEVKKALERVGK